MAGRLSGIFVAKILKPRNMIVISLVGCLAASILLVVVGTWSVIGVYIGTCKIYLLIYMYLYLARVKTI